jgi:N-acetylneuraminic acid mutarotase
MMSPPFDHGCAERLGALVAVSLICFSARASLAEWSQLPSLPDKEGLSGSFAGVSNGSLLVAGGANFPDKKPWDGGKKTWYDAVFVLEPHAKAWRVAGKLPRPLAYGVSATYKGSIVCVGGSNSNGHYADAFRLEWPNGSLVTSLLPSLPTPLANSCGAIVGDCLYVASGISRPDSQEATRSVWRIDLSAAKPGWKEIESMPGAGRMLSIASGKDGTFWIIGGAALEAESNGLVKRRYLRDGYRYEPKTGWTQIPDLPRAIAAAPSPAPEDADGLYVLGGDDGSQLDAKPNEHGGFSSTILRYDVAKKRWSEAGDVAASRVTVPCVRWNDGWVIPGGEVRPGVRSPEVWSWTRKATE